MRENGKYRILQSCYWMLINIIFGYIVFYLSKYGYTAGQIGILTAFFSALTAVCQPILGCIADKRKSFGWKPQILVFSAVGCIGFLLLSITKHSILVGLLFGIIILMINCIQPMLNAACFYYQKQGIHIDFGNARGLGSLSYAVMSVILGFLTVRYGTAAILVAGIFMLTVQFAFTAKMPYGNLSNEIECNAKQKEALRRTSVSESKETSDSSKSFVKKYPAFLLMIVGCILLITAHNFNFTYLLNIIESVGGNSSHMGTALAIGALTEFPILFLFTKIVKRIPSSFLMVICGFSYVIKCLVLLGAGNIWMIYGSQLLQPFAYGLYASATIYFADECMKEEDKMVGQSLMTMAMAVGSVTGNLFGGWLIDLSGVKTMLGVAVILTGIATGIVILSVVLYRKSLQKAVK